MMYVITGATGNIGSQMISHLSPGENKVRVVGRDMKKLEPLTSSGAEAFAADMADSKALTEAFSGATAIYAMIPPHPFAEDFRGYQNQIADSLCTAIAESGCKKVVFLSSVGAQLPEKTGPITGLYDAEQKLNKLEGVDILHLRPTYFMENLFMTLEGIKQQGVFALSTDPTTKMAMIATRDIAEYAAKRMLAADFSGHSAQELLGDRDYTFEETASILQKALGLESLPYHQLPYEVFEKILLDMGLSQSVVDAYVEMDQGFNSGHIVPEVGRDASSTTSTSLEEFSSVIAGAYHSGS